MYEVPLREVMVRNHSKMLLVAPDLPVAAATRAMARAAVGAVLVVERERLIGIFTERDLLLRVVAQGLDPAVTPLSQVMTPSPRTLAPEQPFGTALALMHKKGFRHVPVVQDGRPIGIVFARDALDPDMEDFVAESRRRDRYAVAD
jgi:CBS domain-containing protein